MSFRLAGDQYGAINLIQKRRVSDLLGSNIPAEEAFLMRNGKYACLVCHHRPTFDTVSMLSQHRSGQKHIKAAHSLLKRKHFDREEVEKRKQMQQLTEGSSRVVSNSPEAAPLLVQAQAASRHALLHPNAPYSSLAMKRKKAKDQPEDEDGELLFFSAATRGHRKKIQRHSVIHPESRDYSTIDVSSHSAANTSTLADTYVQSSATSSSLLLHVQLQLLLLQLPPAPLLSSTTAIPHHTKLLYLIPRQALPHQLPLQVLVVPVQV